MKHVSVYLIHKIVQFSLNKKAENCIFHNTFIIVFLMFVCLLK